MSMNKDSNGKKTPRFSIPRWVVPIYWTVGLLIAHAAVPWVISFLGPRLGWSEGNPGVINLYAVVLIAIGLAIVLWTMSLHFVRTSQRVEFEGTPTYLLTQGPYQFSRNPMYLGEMVLWFGWVVFFGSISVLIVSLLLVLLMNYRAIPREEHNLEARFGDAYVQYKKRVPRWFGIPRNQA
jgi:protein-S-isoprenylcysteine O-methyltransferase Ste14